MLRRMLRSGCFLIFLLLAGCQESVDPVLGTDRPFSLYGVLNPRADTQHVRVFEVDDVLKPVEPLPIDARVTSEDLTTGQRRTWQDSIIQYEDSTYGHVFGAPFAAEHGHTYRIEVTRSDEATSRVTVTVPPRVEVSPGAPRGRQAFVWPVLVEGEDLRLYKPGVTYWFQYTGFPEDTMRVSFPYEERRTGDGWRFDIDITQDYHQLLKELGGRYNEDCGLMLLGLRLEARVVNENWRIPEDATDPRDYMQPGVFSNVENGFGFVGGGYVKSKEWYPRQEELTGSPFIHQRDGFPEGCPQPDPRPPGL